MPELSEELISIFQNIDISPSKINEEIYHYIPVTDRTNEFTAISYLAFPLEYVKKYGALTNEIKTYLTTKGHFISTDVVTSLMIMFTICPREKRTPAIIGQYFSLVTDIKLKQYLFLEGKASEDIYQLKFFDYSIGKMEIDKFEIFLNNHAKTDYVKKYKKHLENAPGIEVKSKQVQVIDVYSWLMQCGIRASAIPTAIQDRVNLYLQAVSGTQFEQFKKDFREQQQFITATYGVIYTLEDFERIGCRFINVFYGFLTTARHGWVFSTIRHQTELSFPDPNLLKEVSSFLKTNAGLLSNDDSPFFRPMKIYADILANGERQLMDKNVSHAFVDFFVGLDFLLAPDTEKSKKLKSRIALLTFGYFKEGFFDQVALLDKLYNCRNDYVHFGKILTMEDTIALRDITKVVMAIILNLHKKHLKKTGDYLEKWLKSTDDLVVRIYEKNKFPNDKELRDLGIYDLDYIILHSKYKSRVP